MKRVLGVIIIVMLLLAIEACGSSVSDRSDVTSSLNTASQVGSSDSDPDIPDLPKLFNAYFLVYARSEKPFSWEAMSEALTADGYIVIEPVEGGFAVYDRDDENIWLGGNMTGDRDSYELSELGYYSSMDYEGVVVRFVDKGNRYFIISSVIEQTEVDSLEEIIEHLLRF